MKDKFENITFIPPKRQSRLNGELGLSVSDIAKSLGIDSKTVNRKIVSRDMIDRLAVLGLHTVIVTTRGQVASTKDKVLCGTLLEKLSNNSAIRLSSEGTILDLNAAKFFLAKYENKVGDEYLAYLVKHESDTMGLSTHTDPTNLTELLGNPDTILRLAQNWKDALAVAEEQKERADKAVRARSQISSSREASVMGKLGAEKRKTRMLETKLDISENWKSVAAWVQEFPQLQAIAEDSKKLGKMFTAMSITSSLGVKKIPDERWGTVNSYSRDSAILLMEKFCV